MPFALLDFVQDELNLVKPEKIWSPGIHKSVAKSNRLSGSSCKAPEVFDGYVDFTHTDFLSGKKTCLCCS